MSKAGEIISMFETSTEEDVSWNHVYNILKHKVTEDKLELYAYVIYKTFQGLKRGKNPVQAFSDAAEDENLHGDRPDIVKDRLMIIGFLDNYFGIKVNPQKVKI